MANYDLFSKHFDELMVNPIAKAKRIENYIRENFPNAKSVLDLGCGTGSILHNLSNKYDKTGIDLSANMLSIAKHKVKSAKFYQQDMTSFKLEKKFDVIICIYDSINHLIDFKDWEKQFHNVKSHLNENGLFIFDVNTPYRLKKLAESGTQLQQFGKGKKNFCSISVSQKSKNIFNWSVKIFEHKQANTYLLLEENISEACFPTSKIKNTLRKEFYPIFAESNERGKPSPFSERIWFLCKN